MKKPLLMILALSIVQIGVEYVTLPPTVASHFGPDGKPNAFMSKSAFCGLHLFIVTLLAAVFGAVGRMVSALPIEMINLPHKDYWLAPERRQESLDRLDELLRSNHAGSRRCSDVSGL
jgi:hypothetical protein